MSIDETTGTLRSARSQPLEVELTGGSESQRAAVREVLAQFDDPAVKVIEVDSARHATEGSDVGCALLMMAILDSADQDNWRAILHPPDTTRQPPLVAALLPDCSPDTIRAALRAGADDVLNAPPTRDEAVRCLLKASELRRRDEKRIEKIICSLVSVGSGGSLGPLAVNIGFAMRRLLQSRVALVDLDLQAAPLAVLLDIEPEHTISELADPTSAIDSIRLESVLCKHESGLHLLGAPKRIEDAELISSSTIEATLKVLRELFNVTLIDCGTYINENSVVVWENSDWLLYVIEQSVTGIRAAQRFLNLYHRLGLRDLKPSLVLNRYDRDNPITPQQIESALHLPIFATVPRDDYVFTEMQITGKSAWKVPAGSAVRSSFEALARKLLGNEEAGSNSRPGLMGRLLSTLGF